MRPYLPLAPLLIVGLVWSVPSRAGTLYQITDLGILGGDSSYIYGSYAYGINNRGQITGKSLTSDGSTHAFLYSNGHMTDLGTLPTQYNSYSSAINDSGTIVGTTSVAGDDPRHAFVDTNGVMAYVGNLGNYYSQAYGINDAGTVVGYAVLSLTSGDQAFVYQGGQITYLGNFPGVQTGNSTAYAINDSGQITGFATNTSNYLNAFIYSNGQMLDIGTPGGLKQSIGESINASGDVVGYGIGLGGGPGSGQAFLYSNGKMVELAALPGVGASEALSINSSGLIVGDSFGYADVLSHATLWLDNQPLDLNNLVVNGTASNGNSWLLQSATSINDSGEIVGYGINPDGVQHAFELTPLGLTVATPEPSSWLSAGIAALLLAGYFRLRAVRS